MQIAKQECLSQFQSECDLQNTLASISMYNENDLPQPELRRSFISDNKTLLPPQRWIATADLMVGDFRCLTAKSSDHVIVHGWTRRTNAADKRNTS